jgi:hypothetical protein
VRSDAVTRSQTTSVTSGDAGEQWIRWPARLVGTKRLPVQSAPRPNVILKELAGPGTAAESWPSVQLMFGVP